MNFWYRGHEFLILLISSWCGCLLLRWMEGQPFLCTGVDYGVSWLLFSLSNLMAQQGGEGILFSRFLVWDELKEAITKMAVKTQGSGPVESRLYHVAAQWLREGTLWRAQKKSLGFMLGSKREMPAPWYSAGFRSLIWVKKRIEIKIFLVPLERSRSPGSKTKTQLD